MKIVLNRRFGMFYLSEKAYEMLGLEWDGYGQKYFYHDAPDKRTDPRLVRVVEVLGAEAGGKGTQLEVIEIPDGIEFEVVQNDGMEWVEEKHRTWPNEDN